MRKRKVCLILASLLLAGAVSSPVLAQGDQLDSDIRLFTVLTALNLVGFDDGFGSPSDSPVRRAIREDLKNFDGSSLELLRNFYGQFKKSDPGENLSQYISFALICDGPPTFDTRAELPTDLPEDVRPLRPLSRILGEFYQQADIEKLWNTYQLAYEEEILRYQEPLIPALFEAGGYLRVGPSSREVQSFRVLFSLLGTPNTVHTRSYRGDVIVVVHPSTEIRVNEIRQAFLMHLLDRLSIRYATEVSKKDVLARFALFAPALEDSYKTNFQLLVSKSLATAVEIRLGEAEDAPARVQAAMEQGYILTAYFHEQLEQYEKQGQDMSHYYPEMIKSIDLRREAARLQNLNFAPAPARARPRPARPQVSELDRTLREAELFLRDDDAGKARAKFLEVLEKDGRNAQAHYGLGRVALTEGDPDLARNSFSQTIDVSTDPHLTAMSHIYIARIEDLFDNRELAVEHYRLALEAGDSSERVRSLAEQGLAGPFTPPSREAREEGVQDGGNEPDRQ